MMAILSWKQNSIKKAYSNMPGFVCPNSADQAAVASVIGDFTGRLGHLEHTKGRLRS